MGFTSGEKCFSQLFRTLCVQKSGSWHWSPKIFVFLFSPVKGWGSQPHSQLSCRFIVRLTRVLDLLTVGSEGSSFTFSTFVSPAHSVVCATQKVICRQQGSRSVAFPTVRSLVVAVWDLVQTLKSGVSSLLLSFCLLSLF